MKVFEKEVFTIYEDFLLLIILAAALATFYFLFGDEPSAKGIFAMILAFFYGLWFGIFLRSRINRHTETLLKYIPLGCDQSIIKELILDSMRKEELYHVLYSLFVWASFWAALGNKVGAFLIFSCLGYMIASPVEERLHNRRIRKRRGVI